MDLKNYSKHKQIILYSIEMKKINISLIQKNFFIQGYFKIICLYKQISNRFFKYTMLVE